MENTNSEIIKDGIIKELAKSYPIASKSDVENEISLFLDKNLLKLEDALSENPFQKYEEQFELAKQAFSAKNYSASDYLQSLNCYKEFRKSQNQPANIKDDTPTKRGLKTAYGLLLKVWEREITEAKIAWRLAEIDRFRSEWMKNLSEWLQLIQQLDLKIGSFSFDFGRLFDLSVGRLTAHDIEQIRRLVEYIEKNENVRKLCELIGHIRKAEHKERQEHVKQMADFEIAIIDTNSNEEIIGIKIGDDIENVLPQELTLLNISELELLFDKKFVEKQLLCFDHSGFQFVSYQKEVDSITTTSLDEKNGPIIMCVDTSGSMSGTPEAVAKAIALYIATAAKQQKRACYLINFSTQIECFDFSKVNGVSHLLQFLSKSFYGGTDATPALKHAVHMLESDGYSNADVLVISDFVMGKISSELNLSIKEFKQKKIKFYSVIIGDTGLHSPMNEIFDKEWRYDPSSSDIYEITKDVFLSLKNHHAQI